MSTLTFETLCKTAHIHPKLQQAIQALGYQTPTEIQKEAIPPVLEGKDVIASAETGGGKTVAFSLPALQKILQNPPKTQTRGPRVLILTPTRELAQQIYETIYSLTKFAHLKFGVITGGVGYPAQEQLLRKPLDILIATPGRLMDHMESKRVDFSRLDMFILDEADRMLDMGFIKDMEHIAAMLPKEHQTLLFSATLEGPIQKIAQKFLKDPVKIQLTTASQKHRLISQHVHLVDNIQHKRALLTHILEDANVWQAIVFTATKHGADELADELSQQGIVCSALHGDMKQSRRTRILEKMHRGKLRVLVATDVAARGLDVKKLTHVVNFDLPKTGEDYVHRIGRTGRSGNQGIAISLVGPREGDLLSQIERFTAQKIKQDVIPGFEPKVHVHVKTTNKPYRPHGQGGSRGSSGGNAGFKKKPQRRFGKPTENSSPFSQSRRPKGQGPGRGHGHGQSAQPRQRHRHAQKEKERTR